MTELTALLGIHDEILLETFKDMLEYYGYSVTKAPTPEEMIRLAEQNRYYAHIMDLNLGKPGSSDVTPSVNVYRIVKSRVDAGEAKFIGISGDLTAVDMVQKQGVPAFYKADFKIVEFAKQTHKS